MARVTCCRAPAKKRTHGLILLIALFWFFHFFPPSISERMPSHEESYGDHENPEVYYKKSPLMDRIVKDDEKPYHFRRISDERAEEIKELSDRDAECEAMSSVANKVALEAVSQTKKWDVFPLENYYVSMLELTKGFMMGMNSLKNPENIDISCLDDTVVVRAILTLPYSWISFRWLAPALKYSGVVWMSAYNVKLNMSASYVYSSMNHPSVRINEMTLKKMDDFSTGNEGLKLLAGFDKTRQTNLLMSVYLKAITNAVKEAMWNRFQSLIEQAWLYTYKNGMQAKSSEFDRFSVEDEPVQFRQLPDPIQNDRVENPAAVHTIETDGSEAAVESMESSNDRSDAAAESMESGVGGSESTADTMESDTGGSESKAESMLRSRIDREKDDVESIRAGMDKSSEWVEPMATSYGKHETELESLGSSIGKEVAEESMGTSLAREEIESTGSSHARDDAPEEFMRTSIGREMPMENDDYFGEFDTDIPRDGGGYSYLDDLEYQPDGYLREAYYGDRENDINYNALSPLDYRPDYGRPLGNMRGLGYRRSAYQAPAHTSSGMHKPSFWMDQPQWRQGGHF